MKNLMKTNNKSEGLKKFDVFYLYKKNLFSKMKLCINEKFLKKINFY